MTAAPSPATQPPPQPPPPGPVSSGSLVSFLQWESLVAGVTGGTMATVVLHPLDLVKIRFQVNEGTGVVERPKYQGLGHALKTIFRDGGVRGLYQGIVPNVSGAGMSWGLYFLFYNSGKQWMQGGDATRQLSAATHMTTAAISGAITLSFTNPIWVTKTRLCLQYESEYLTNQSKAARSAQSTPYKGMFDALSRIARTEGLVGLYRGLIPGLLGVSHGAIQFMAYEELKNRYNNYLEQPINRKLGTLEYLSFAAISKILAVGATYPYQVVRSRLQEQHRVYSGAMEVVRLVWRHEGFAGYYKGLWPSLLRVTPACCITFLVYENLIVHLKNR